MNAFPNLTFFVESQKGYLSGHTLFAEDSFAWMVSKYAFILLYIE